MTMPPLKITLKKRSRTSAELYSKISIKRLNAIGVDLKKPIFIFAEKKKRVPWWFEGNDCIMFGSDAIEIYFHPKGLVESRDEFFTKGDFEI